MSARKASQFWPLALAGLVSLSNAYGATTVSMDANGDTIPDADAFVTSGTLITLTALFDASAPGPSRFDAVSMSLDFSGTAVATFIDVRADQLAGAGSPSIDMNTSTPVIPDDPLTPIAGSSAVFIAAAGYSDQSAGAFSGIGDMPGGTTHKIMHWRFTVTGPVGSSVTFTPRSGLVEGAQQNPPSGNNMFADKNTAIGFDPDVVSPIAVTIVPEPSVALLLGLSGAGMVLVSRRRM